MQREVTTSGLAAKTTWPVMALKVLGSTMLLIALLSVDYKDLTISRTILLTPIQLTLVAFIDTLVLSYLVLSSRWGGWREWGAVFSALYGMNYVLTAVESVYLGSILSTDMVIGLLANGAITSAIFSAFLVWILGKRGTRNETQNDRLVMGTREWTWKILGSGAVYLLLFILFGFAVYYPLARALDPAALAREQTIAASSAALVFPVEVFRGAFWALLAVPAIVALRFDWKRSALMTGLLFAVPISGNILLATTMTPGLQIAHFAEVFGENLVFGLLVVWILHLRSRLPSLDAKSTVSPLSVSSKV